MASEQYRTMMYPEGFYGEARAIVAELPQPVDPDLLEARKMRLDEVGEHASADYVRYMNDGSYDTDSDVVKFVAAIKRGRALARGEP